MTLDQFITEGRITERDLAARVGVNRSTIFRIRKGSKSASLRLALKLAEETNLPVAAFLKAS
jgi:DNA-binding XRE family transcriptional regulator